MLAQLLLSVSAAALVSAQSPFNPNPAVEPSCTSNSFTKPSWLVQKFQTSGANASFHLYNRATNGSADLSCALSGSGWSACSVQNSKQDLQVSLQIDGSAASVKVNETWVCNDRAGADRHPFSGAATTKFELTCAADKSCVSTNPQILLKATLSSPIAATPSYIEGQPGHDRAGCKAGSQNPSWTMTLGWYVDQAGDGISAMPATSVNFIFSNDANGYQVSCMIGDLSGEEEVPAGKLVPMTCAGYEFQSSTTGLYSPSTTVTFDPATFTFNLNQTWYCDDTDPGRPIAITGLATQVLPLNCTTEKVYGFPRKTCQGEKDITIKGKKVSETSLTPFSISDPLPTADGCTISSIYDPKWSLSAFSLDTKSGGSSAANASSSGAVNFNIILATASRGFQFPISVAQGAPVAGSAGWYQCVVGPDGGIGQPLWPYSCSFKYDAASKGLTIKADWMCTDIDKDHPVLFSGVTTTMVNSTLTCGTADGLSRCQTADPGYSWDAPISNVTWKAGP